MNQEIKKYIIENIGKKSIKTMSRDLGVKERKIKKCIQILKNEPDKIESYDKNKDIKFNTRPLLSAALLIIILITALAFLPSLFNNFVNWDDNDYVFQNNVIKHFSVDNMKKIFSESFAGTYCPLVMITYSLEYHFFKLNPFIYHFTNYLLHIAITVLVFVFIYAISQEPVTAFITSLVFGIHPLHVESVAWVSERKDVLSAFFFMLCLIMYQRYIKKIDLRYYLLAFLFLTLSLFSKATAIAVPLILLLIDYFNRRKINLKVLTEKIPFFLIALIFGIINIYFQSQAGAVGLNAHVMVKIYFLLKTIPFYLAKTIVPLNLSAIYFYHSITTAQNAEMILNVLLLAILCGLVIFSLKYTRKILFGTAFFILALLPVLKLVPFGDAFAADRYIYLPSIGIFYIFSVIVAGIVFQKALIIPDFIKKAVIGLIIVLVMALSILTWQRCQVWKNDGSLFLDVAKYYPDDPTVNNHLGLMHAKNRDFEKAIAYFKKGLSEKPSEEMKKILQWNLGGAYQEMNR